MTFSLFDLAFVGSLTAAAAYDPDAQDFINRVIAADVAAGNTSGLEVGVQDAYNDFFVGCKADGTFNALKAACILAGARTLAGALVPLVGTAPTNYNFVAGDYNRETGLKGDGSTKYLDSGRANNADPQDNKHLSIYKTEAPTAAFSSYIAAQATTPVSSASRISHSATALFGINTSSFPSTPYSPSQLGFMAVTRSSSVSYSYRANSTTTTSSVSSNANISLNVFVFCRNLNGSPSQPTDARLAFYSIGENLDLALLDARVTALISAIGVAIP